MKKSSRKFSLRKKLLFATLGLIVVLFLIVGCLLAYVYFSPGRIRNFPIGDRRMQINITPGGINIFFPRDATSDYYSRNFSGWQVITGVNNKYQEIDYSYKPEPTYPEATPVQPIPYASTVLTKYKYDETAPKGSLKVNFIINLVTSTNCSPYDRRYCLVGPSEIGLEGWRIGDDGKIALYTQLAFYKRIFIKDDDFSETINNITPGEYIIEYMYKDPTEKDTAPNVIIRPGETTTLNIDLTEYYH